MANIADRHPRRDHPKLNIPWISHPRQTLNFGQLDSDYTQDALTLQLANQVNLPTAVYETISSLVTIDLGITLETFIRIWRTIMLKRAQDVAEELSGARTNNYLRFTRSIPLPGPLYDLIDGLGIYDSKIRGVTYFVNPPERPAAQAPNYWTYNVAAMQQWIREMRRIGTQYVVKDYPDKTTIHNRPLVLTTFNDTNHNETRLIYGYTNEPTKNDALIRFVNDDLFDQHEYVTFANSHTRLSRKTDISAVRADYVASYDLESNS